MFGGFLPFEGSMFRYVVKTLSLCGLTTICASDFYSEKALQSLLESLTCPPYTPTQHLEREQALAKEFAEILHFTLRFDELKVNKVFQYMLIFAVYSEPKLIISCFSSWKMRNPAIQNDFSYYRRTISRNRINNMHVSK